MHTTGEQNLTNPILPAYSLRWRLLALLGGMFLITLLAIGTGVFYFISQNEQHAWQGRQGEAARHAGDTVVVFVQRMEDTMSLVSSLQRDELIANPQLMPRLLKQNPALLELIRLDANGQIFANAHQDEPILMNLFTVPQSRWFLESQAGKLYLGNVQISSAGEPYLIMSIPAPDGGVMAARLRMNVLWNVVADLRFGETGQAYVVNRQGQIVAHTNPAIALAHTTLQGRPEMSTLLQTPNQEWNGAYVNFEGDAMIGVTSPVHGTEWVVITEVTEAEAFAVSRTALFLLSGGLALFGLLVILVTGRFLGILILQPMENLRAGARRIGRGDLNYQINLPRQDEVGQVARAFNTMVNRLRDREAQVAERTQALQESEERFRQVVTSISDHIYMTEIATEGGHQNHYLSPNVETLTGYPLEQFMTNWNFWPSTIIHPDDRAAAAGQAARLAQGQNSEAEYRLVRADGAIIWIRDSGRVEKDVAKQRLVVYGVVSDIHERKQAEISLALARDQALEASRFKSELVAKVSHELRTPLGSILGFAEMIQDGFYGPPSDDQSQVMEEIIDSAQYLTNRVNELLDQARLETGKLKLNISSFAPADLINDTLSKMQVLAKNKGLTLTANIAVDMPDTISNDLDRLKQIVINLLGNAIKFTQQGKIEVNLRRSGPTHWALQVTDTGPGIPVKAQSVIFESFKQVDGSMTREQIGTGLGLSIVKQLTTLMGGQINLQSELGQGSDFTILLPLEPIQEETA